MNNLKAIVLKAEKRNEQDFLLVCLTEELGKIYLIAPRAAKLNNPIRKFCQVLSYGIIQVRKGQNSQSLFYLNQAEVLNTYKGVKSHEFKLASAGYVTNVIAGFLEIGGRDSYSFHLLTSYLSALNLLETDKEINFLHVYILVKLIEYHGINSVINNNTFSEEHKDIYLKLKDFNLVKDKWFDITSNFIICIEKFILEEFSKEVNGYSYLKLIRGY